MFQGHEQLTLVIEIKMQTENLFQANNQIRARLVRRLIKATGLHQSTKTNLAQINSHMYSATVANV